MQKPYFSPDPKLRRGMHIDFIEIYFMKLNRQTLLRRNTKTEKTQQPIYSK